ncbi:hypothetical protein E4U55_001245 [Claviceps digitariae]|nr:hypothetical protein E4U55_001245 [Claviceps digitariae]
MSRRFYIETSASGKNRFIAIKRSRSHSHHDHHHHRHKKHHGSHHHDHSQSQETCFETQDYYKVRVDDWNHLKERERHLQEANSHLATEVSTLKANLAAVQAEAHNLSQVVVPQLHSQIGILTTDNEALRKSLDNAGNNEGKHCREEEKLKQTIDKLDKEKKELKDENATLKDKLKTLQRQTERGGCDGRCSRSRSRSRSRSSDLLLDEIEHWRNLYRHWKDKHDDAKRLHDDVCATLEIRTEKMRAYEEILKRRRII